VDGTGVGGIWGDSGRMDGGVGEDVNSRHRCLVQPMAGACSQKFGYICWAGVVS
jgi:hypothetical protein